MPRSTSSFLNEFVTETIESARLYRNISNFSSNFIANESFIAPTAVIDAGHMSLNSNTNFFRLNADIAHPRNSCKKLW